jgi:20S proteasome subunit alpha 5|mmetsp:Transcript_11246/g.16104  ORF Transcript_11246/g.16104 Transcript_11246/m.16104 type:complete len:215 (-) Transcript_11246:939-1583(-)
MNESVNFSSDGRLIQLECATEAIKLGSIVLGINTKSCVLLILEKRKDDTLNESIIGQKMIKFNKSLCCVISGLTSDARFLIEQIQIKLSNYFFVSNEHTNVENCGKIIFNSVSLFNNGNGQKYFKSRPLGVAFLLCGIDQDGSSLIQIDPSGTIKKKNYASLGSGQEESLFMLKESYRKNMSSKETLILGEKILRILIEKNFNLDNHEYCLLVC